MSIAPEQTSNLAKVITPFESKTKSGQFVLQSPNGSIDSSGRAGRLVQLGGNLTEHLRTCCALMYRSCSYRYARSGLASIAAGSPSVVSATTTETAVTCVKNEGGSTAPSPLGGVALKLKL
jgi:hypothetical protein